jgi:ATP-dependent Clp protease ATP-binding subunit ClpX
MYELPRNSDIAKCVITKEVVLNREEPIIVTSDRKKGKKKEVTA